MGRLTNFDDVFEHKLNKIVKRVKEHLKKPKKERNHILVMTLLREAKELKRLLKDK